MSVQSRYPIKYHGALKAPYMAAPLELARDTVLNDGARSVAMWMWSHMEGYRISQRSVQTEMGKGQGSVERAFKELTEARWLVRQRIVKSPNARQAAGYIYHLARDSRFTVEKAEELSRDQVMGAADPVVNAPISIVGAPVVGAGGAPDSGAACAPVSGAQRSTTKKFKEETNLPRYRADDVNLWSTGVEALIKARAAEQQVTSHEIYQSLKLSHGETDLFTLDQWRSDIDALELTSVS